MPVTAESRVNTATRWHQVAQQVSFVEMEPLLASLYPPLSSAMHCRRETIASGSGPQRRADGTATTTRRTEGIQHLVIRADVDQATGHCWGGLDAHLMTSGSGPQRGAGGMATTAHHTESIQLPVT